MGIDLTTHVGPYFCCKPTRGTATNDRRSCTNGDCAEHKRPVHDKQVKFCTRCGAEVSTYTYTEERNLQHGGQVACEELSDAVQFVRSEHTDCHIFVPNARRDEPRSSMSVSNKHETAYIDLSDPETINREKRWLVSKFAKEHERLEELYGRDNVTVCWGVICEMH